MLRLSSFFLQPGFLLPVLCQIISASKCRGNTLQINNQGSRFKGQANSKLQILKPKQSPNPNVETLHTLSPQTKGLLVVHSHPISVAAPFNHCEATSLLCNIIAWQHHIITP
jgi:hypothetical protein